MVAKMFAMETENKLGQTFIRTLRNPKPFFFLLLNPSTFEVATLIFYMNSIPSNLWTPICVSS